MRSSIKTLRVLVLDCQATSASPKNGQLLEIGWAATAADREDAPACAEVNSFLVKLPDDAEIPSAVTRVTGINPESQADAVGPEQVWQELDRYIRETATSAGLDQCPAVIHFARYETPFLKDLYSRYAPDRQFPLQVVCTHEIARRLLPGLPRKGLRAVAGYFGHSVNPQRRCTTHVQATVLIWHHLVRELESKQSINSWEALLDWLGKTKPQPRPERKYPLDPDIRKELPDRSGIYRMLRSNGDLLYVGKAKSLKKRVNSYFRPKARHAEHTLEMLSQARRLEVTTTATALEAALLECDQIKKLEPPYNVSLKSADRELVFFSQDLADRAAGFTDGQWVGPLPAARLAESLQAFAGWWSDPGKCSGDAGLAILNMPASYEPPSDCAHEGLELFRRAHAESQTGSSPLRDVAALGAKFWREKLALVELEDDTIVSEEVEGDEAGDVTEGREWTPEAVQRSIEHMVSHAAHMLRRARWFCLLSESSLVWEARADHHGRRLIIIRKGHLTQGHFLQDNEDLPIPDRHQISQKQRRRNLDLETYDRLRVLTTEIRRLTSENRHPALCLGPGRVLGDNQLRQLLKWV